MWAIAVDEGWVHSIEEFGRMTPGMFDELWKRRVIRHRYSCLYAGMVAAAVMNFAGKQMRDGHTVKPFDFVPMPNDKRRRLADLRTNIQNTVNQIVGTTGGKADLRKVLRNIASSPFYLQEGFTQEELDAIVADLTEAWKLEG